MIYVEWSTIDKNGARVIWDTRDEAVAYILRRIRYDLTVPDQEKLECRTISDWYDIRVVDKTDAPV
jgi:hypothetical protein